MRDGAKLTDEQLRLLIFEAGFSTKDEVNDLSGRGVGMDVVKRNVSELNGHITLDSKERIWHPSSDLPSYYSGNHRRADCASRDP